MLCAKWLGAHQSDSVTDTLTYKAPGECEPSYGVSEVDGFKEADQGEREITIRGR